MTDESTPSAAERGQPSLPPFAWGGVLLILAVKVLLHLPMHPAYGYFRDELYYLACADNLAWGYVDHPPLSIAILAATRFILGDALWAIRLPVVLAGAASLFITAMLAREMGGGKYAQVLAALTLLIAPVYLAMGSFYSMNTFEQVAWPLCALLLARIIRTGDANLWLWFGAVAGLGLLNKHSMVVFGFALVAALLFTPHRTQLLKPQVYLGGVIAVVLFLPHLIWQAMSGFPTLDFMRAAQAGKMVAHSAPEFLFGQVLLIHPLNLLIWPVGLACLLFAPWLRAYRVLGIAFLIVIAINLLTVAKTYYPNPAYPMLFAAAGVAYARWFEAPKLRVLRFALPGVIVAGGLPLLPITLPIIAPESLLAYTQAIGISAPREEHSHQELELDQHMADRLGWEELTAAVEAVVADLTPEERSGAVIFGSNYGNASALQFFGSGLPPVISGHNAYWYWGHGDADGSVVIGVGMSADGLAPMFESVESVARVDAPLSVVHGTVITVGRNALVSIDTIWPQLKLGM